MTGRHVALGNGQKAGEARLRREQIVGIVVQFALTLSNGIEVVLGRDQVTERFDRFVTVYQERLVSRANEVKRVDARYSNGVAVKWKPDATASGKNT